MKARVYLGTIQNVRENAIVQERAKVLKVEDLRVPIHICLGAYEAASKEELDELIQDLEAERARR